jgi:hypothetical protein
MKKKAKRDEPVKRGEVRVTRDHDKGIQVVEESDAVSFEFFEPAPPVTCIRSSRKKRKQ